MKSQRSGLWPVLGLTALACMLLLLFGFGWALKDTYAPSSGLDIPSAKPSPSTSGDWTTKKTAMVTAIGDSLTRGTGDATGEGYVRRTIKNLNDSLGKDKVRLLNNLGINGLEAANLALRLDDKGMRTAISQSDLILVTIGGNDLFQTAQSGGSIADGGEIDVALLKTRLEKLKPRLKTVLGKIRAINPNARIVYVGLYNPFYELKEPRAAISSILAEWNGYAVQVAEADGGITVVPTYDLFEGNSSKYLASDHFHPNGPGYARIAERVAQALL